MNRLTSKNGWPIFSVQEEIQITPPFVSRNSPPYPDGEFLVPLCLTARQLTKLLSAAVMGAELAYPDESMSVIQPLLQAAEYVDAPFEAACIDMTDRRYRITEDCLFQESTDGTNWTTIRDLAALDCLTNNDGRTPELRGVRAGDGLTLEWKYTDEPASAWRSAGFIEDGEDGDPGSAGRTPELRTVSISSDSRRIEWKYVDEDSSAWRTLTTIEDGSDGDPAPLPQMRVDNCLLQWRPTNTAAWTTLYNLADDPCDPDADGGSVSPPPSTVSANNRCAAAIGLMQWLERSYQDVLNVYDASSSSVDLALNAWNVVSPQFRNTLRRFQFISAAADLFAQYGSVEVETIEASLTLARREELQETLYCAGSNTFTASMFTALKSQADQLGYGEVNNDNRFNAFLDSIGIEELQDRWNLYLRGSSALCAGYECVSDLICPPTFTTALNWSNNFNTFRPVPVVEVSPTTSQWFATLSPNPQGIIRFSNTRCVYRVNIRANISSATWQLTIGNETFGPFPQNGGVFNLIPTTPQQTDRILARQLSGQPGTASFSSIMIEIA